MWQDALKVLTQALDGLLIAREDRLTTGVAVSEEFDHTSSGRRTLGDRATATVSVRTTDPELVGRLISRVTEDAQASIAGLYWYVSASNPLRLEAAERAAQDAKRRAKAYASGVGARLGPLLRLDESSRDVQGFKRLRGPAPISIAAAGGMPIEAGEQDVQASVEATFSLEL